MRHMRVHAEARTEASNRLAVSSLNRCARQRDATLNHSDHHAHSTMNTVHLQPLSSRSRTVIRKDGPLFNQHVLHHLAATAVLHHIPDANEPGDAVRWSLALAGLAYSDRANEEAWA
jgi:hypothetical protein